MGSIYHPPSQGGFTETITKHFSKINTSEAEIYILGDFIINLVLNQKYVLHQSYTQSMSHENKNYSNFKSIKKLLKYPTGVTCSASSLIDHVLTTFP